MRMAHFLEDESGAVTIDWVALTAGILLLGIMVVYAVFNDGVGPLLDTITENLSNSNNVVDVGEAPNLNDGAGGGGDAQQDDGT